MKGVVHKLLFAVIIGLSHLASAGDSNITSSATKSVNAYSQHQQRPELLERINSNDILILENYALSLLERYPPESHQLVMLGAQNLVLSAVMKNLLDNDEYEHYVRDVTVNGLRSASKAMNAHDLNRIFGKIFPSAEELAGRQVVVVRVLNIGFSMYVISSLIDSFLKSRGITPLFDFIIDSRVIAYNLGSDHHDLITLDDFRKLFESRGVNISITHDPNYKRTLSCSDMSELQKQYAQYDIWSAAQFINSAEHFAVSAIRWFTELLSKVLAYDSLPVFHYQSLENHYTARKIEQWNGTPMNPHFEELVQLVYLKMATPVPSMKHNRKHHSYLH